MASHPRLPTASALPRAINCPASCVLPQIPSPQNEDQAAGQARHDYLFLVPEVGVEAALAAVPPTHREMCANIDLTGLPLHRDAAREIAVAFDLATGIPRELGRNIGRKYEAAALARGRALGAFEVCGTADVAFIVDGVVHVFDFKGAWGDVGPLADHHQLRALALMLCRLWGCASAVIWRLRIMDDGRSVPDSLAVTARDLEETERRLSEMASSIFAARSAVAKEIAPAVNPGEWCAGCPAWAACPAKTALMRTVIAAPEKLLPPPLSSLTPAEQRAIYLRLRDVRAVVNKAWAEVAAFGANNPIPVDSGRVYGGHPVDRDVIDGAIAFDVVEETYGVSAAKVAVTMESSKAALKRAVEHVRDHAAPPDLAPCERPIKVAPAVRELLDAISKRGGIRVTTSTRIEEHAVSDDDKSTKAA